MACSESDLADPVAVSQAGAPCLLADFVQEARCTAQPVPPGPAEERAVSELFERTLLWQGGFDSLNAAWREWELELLTLEPHDPSVRLLRELPSARRGRGVYAFRRAQNSLVLEAPHADDDRHTGQITARLFEEGSIAAAAWSSVRRSRLDVAHVPHSYFNSFTRAVARVWPHALVVQLHGFDERRHETQLGSAAQLVVSNGTDRPKAWFSTVGRSFASNRDLGRVRVYPYQTHELGATTNAQGQLLRAASHHGFLHLEFDRKLRERLRDDPECRTELLELLEVAWQLRDD
jgi:hypothetical protein